MLSRSVTISVYDNGRNNRWAASTPITFPQSAKFGLQIVDDLLWLLNGRFLPQTEDEAADPLDIRCKNHGVDRACAVLMIVDQIAELMMPIGQFAAFCRQPHQKTQLRLFQLVIYLWHGRERRLGQYGVR